MSESMVVEQTVLSEGEYASRIVPLPDFAKIPEDQRQGRFDNFVDALEADIAKLTERGGSELVLRTWVTELENKNSPGAAGILWAIGVEKTEGALPMTPNLIAIPIDNQQLDNLKKVSESQSVSSKVVYETHREIVIQELGNRLLTKTEYDRDNSDLAMALPTKGLHVYNGGWGHESLVWQEGIEKMIAGFADMNALELENVRNIPAGKRATDHVFVAEAVMGGFKTSPKDHSKVRPEDIVNQPVLGLEAFCKTLIKECGGMGMGEEEMEKAFWQKIMNVFGHSMQGWALALGIKVGGIWLNKLDEVGNTYAKFHLMNMVMIGTDMQRDRNVFKQMQKLIGMTQKPGGHVPLQEGQAGPLVRESGWMMKPDLISENADKLGVVTALIGKFLGNMGETLIPLLAHNHSIRQDNAQIAMNNRLLRKVGLALLGEQHRNKLRELDGQGRLTMWMGKLDEILKPEEQWLLAIFLGLPGYIETTNHYPDKEVMGRFLPVMLMSPRGNGVGVRQVNLGTSFPGIFDKLPELNLVYKRIRERNNIFNNLKTLRMSLVG